MHLDGKEVFLQAFSNFGISKHCAFSDITYANDICAAPHALFSSDPSDMMKKYWMPSLFANILRFFNGEEFGERGEGIGKCVLREGIGQYGVGESRMKMFESVGDEYIESSKRLFRS